MNNQVIAGVMTPIRQWRVCTEPISSVHVGDVRYIQFRSQGQDVIQECVLLRKTYPVSGDKRCWVWGVLARDSDQQVLGPKRRRFPSRQFALFTKEVA